MIKDWNYANWFTSTSRECYKFQTLVHFFRILHKIFIFTYIFTYNGYFNIFTAVTGHHGRKPSRLYVQQVRTDYGRQSLYFLGTRYAMKYPHYIVIHTLLTAWLNLGGVSMPQVLILNYN